MSGFIIYKDAYGHIDIPHEFVVDEEIISLGIGFDEKHEGIFIFNFLLIFCYLFCWFMIILYKCQLRDLVYCATK